MKKTIFLELQVSCHFIDNLQPSNSNGKLLQCYGIFLTSLNLICSKVRNTPQPCDNPAYVEGFMERSLMCWIIIGLGCVSHFGTNEI